MVHVAFYGSHSVLTCMVALKSGISWNSVTRACTCRAVSLVVLGASSW